MRPLKLVMLHYASQMLQLARMPMYLVPTIAFPALLYLFFGLPSGGDADAKRYVMAAFMTFAVLGVSVFQFGVGIAIERATAWERYLRTLSVPMWVRFAARSCSAWTFSIAASALIAVEGVLFAGVRLPASVWLWLFATLLLGGIPMVFLGVSIGYFANARSAVPIANLIYLPLAFVGGLWTAPGALPPAVQLLSPWTPTRRYVDIVWSAAAGRAPQMDDVVVLLAFLVLFVACAVIGYRRDEATRYA